ncbi:hypothetical protein DdX_17506 [Ditylenchus destructor]|uniref:Uncharacterized protein n=1 Tax=Ditylenchus destructor TaxID=166010 RepID=A0AAD4MM05_9BILA|nr:hypothetical protein DdX_17506 [Ditylenchus destructor]
MIERFQFRPSSLVGRLNPIKMIFYAVFFFLTITSPEGGLSREDPELDPRLPYNGNLAGDESPDPCDPCVDIPSCESDNYCRQHGCCG